MKLAQQLANRLNEVLINGKWVTGTNIKSEIINLDWKTATKKINNLNSIADLVFHIDYYIAGVLNVLEGGDLEIKDKFSFNYPPIKSKKDWNALVSKFCKDSEKFITLVSNFTDKELKNSFVNPKYGDFYRNINVIIEHSYYHFGQIILLKKMLKPITKD
ncbi:hypothetical protein SAMN05444411_110138 [Lutibacter oricola]|uniref:DinB superfamily protein n=1 Tax=Lutibacter oricola TaxID=762486 RepID=A0A1H3F6A4_9FLAO|nr:DinB family protein [Lutibacter oricola]SDX86460.1 hypothetical protein SAMN05444411_110138 [Lutibacter oricola]